MDVHQQLRALSTRLELYVLPAERGVFTFSIGQLRLGAAFPGLKRGNFRALNLAPPRCQVGRVEPFPPQQTAHVTAGGGLCHHLPFVRGRERPPARSGTHLHIMDVLLPRNTVVVLR